MSPFKHILTGALALMPLAGQAMDINLPNGAKLTAEIVENSSNYRIPTGSWTGDGIDTISAEGRVAKQAWRINSPRLSTLELIETLENQLSNAGYSSVFECETNSCGGFDFRFAVDILPEPTMHVDLGDFRYLSAKRETGENPEFVSLVVSKSASAGFVQIVHTGGEVSVAHPLTTSTKGARPTTPVVPGSLADQLETVGHFVLEDLEFATGSSNLSKDEFATVAALADYLLSNPERNVALVGHTDAEGSLSGNVALSKKRARSVANILIQNYAVPASQVSAEGMGFLSPRASNLTDEGRAHNRRVEVILTSTE